MMCDNNGECYKIISKDKIAQTNKKGNVLKCKLSYSDIGVEEPCIVSLIES